MEKSTNLKKSVSIKSVEYDVDSSKLRSQPDLGELIKFCADGTHNSMCIEYEDKKTCERRRACLRTWLCNSAYKGMYFSSVRGNKLYIFKEKET